MVNNAVKELSNDEIVLYELNVFADALVSALEDIWDGGTPNIFSTDPEKDAQEIDQYLSALTLLIDIYEVKREVA